MLSQLLSELFELCNIYTLLRFPHTSSNAVVRMVSMPLGYSHSIRHTGVGDRHSPAEQHVRKPGVPGLTPRRGIAKMVGQAMAYLVAGLCALGLILLGKIALSNTNS